MADKVITYGASEGFGAFAGWESQGNTPVTGKQRGVAHSDKGDILADNLVGEKQEVTSRYECNNDTNVVPDAIGAIVNGLVLTGILFETRPNMPATMTLTGHNHTENAHASSPALRTYTHGITVPKCFGVTDFLGDSDGTNDAAIGSSCNITCEHADQDDGDGDHLVGENYNAQIEAKTTYCGDHTVVATGFSTTEHSEPDEATGFIKKEVTGIMNAEMA